MAKRAPARRRPRKAKPGTKGLDPAQCRLEQSEGSASEAAEAVEKAGGCVVGQYKEPLGGHPTLVSILPIDKIEPTPFQRDLSDTHHKRLADVINKTGYFLDPLIAVLAPGGGFWTPNGRHRLEAMRRLGAKSITALVIPEREVAWQILALNTEKAHNLKERSLEVIRIYRGLVDEDGSRPESGFAFYLDQVRIEAAYASCSQEHWIELCERTATEQDSAKLLQLVQEINRLLEEKEELLHAKQPAQAFGPCPRNYT